MTKRGKKKGLVAALSVVAVIVLLAAAYGIFCLIIEDDKIWADASINGVNIQGTGITPDVEVDWPEDAEEFTSPSQFNELSQEEWESKDAQMKKAREVLSEKVAQAEQ